MARIAVIPGDGIGPEVTREALRVASQAAAGHGDSLDYEEFALNADSYLATGTGLPDDVFVRLRDEFDAIFLGALGDPRIPDMAHGKDILLGLRVRLDLYVNLRPVRLLHDALCPLKERGRADVDFVVFRENTEGAYCGLGGTYRKGTADEIAIEQDLNTRRGVERIVRHAFAHAASAAEPLTVCMCDKSNVLTHGHGLWRRVFAEVADEFPAVAARHLYVDALAMEMIRDPSQFDVIVTCNLFGDILTDLGAQLQGGMGLAASANLNPETGAALFESVHGSAPDIAGRGLANPLAAILSAELMLRHLGMDAAARDLEGAVVRTLEEGCTTPDLGGSASTEQVGQRIVEVLRDAA